LLATYNPQTLTRGGRVKKVPSDLTRGVDGVIPKFFQSLPRPNLKLLEKTKSIPPPGKWGREKTAKSPNPLKVGLREKHLRRVARLRNLPPKNLKN